MKKTVNLEIVTLRAIPQWAICFLIYGETDNLSSVDIALADTYAEHLAEERIHLAAPIDGSENEFCSLPAFGDACATVDFHGFREMEMESGVRV